MAHKQSEKPKPNRLRKHWPFIVIGVVIAATLVFVIFPSKLNRTNSGMGIGPRFTKHGEITIVRNTGATILSVEVEIAETPEKRETGMMGRATMDERQGMFFIFEDERPLGFWMKNTILPLDIIFINARNEITTIHHNATPYSEETYQSRGSAQFVLELNAGIAEKYGIVEGDVVRLKR